MAGLGASLFSGLSGGDDYYGRKPVIPPAPTTEDILKKTTAANLAVAPEAAKLAALTNKYNQENILANLRSVLGTEAVDEIPKSISRKLAAEIKGELSPDLADYVQNKSAASALGAGYGSASGMGKNQLARNLGLTSYDVSNKALSSFESWLAASSALLAPTFDLTNMFAPVSLGFEVEKGKFERDYLAELTAAAPDPAKRGRFDSAMAVLGMVLSAYGGGAGYTGKARQPWEGGGGIDEAGSGEGGGGGGGFNFFGLGGGGGGKGWYLGKNPGPG